METAGDGRDNEAGPNILRIGLSTFVNAQSGTRFSIAPTSGTGGNRMLMAFMTFVHANSAQQKHGEQIAATMPIWPVSGSAIVKDGLMVVRLKIASLSRNIANDYSHCSGGGRSPIALSHGDAAQKRDHSSGFRGGNFKAVR